MQVLLTTDRCDRGSFQYAGEVIDLPAAEAVRLIEFGQAEAVETKVEPETATRKHKRTAAIRGSD